MVSHAQLVEYREYLAWAAYVIMLLAVLYQFFFHKRRHKHIESIMTSIANYLVLRGGFGAILIGLLRALKPKKNTKSRK